MRGGMSVLAIVVGFVWIGVALGAVDELAFEAESADIIEAPMEIVEDDDVPGRAYIRSPQGRAGWAEYEIEIPADAEYYLWGMVQEQDGVSDSFFITFDAFDRGNDDDANVNTWDMGGPAGAWGWDAVSGRGVGGDPRVFELDQGTRLLRVWTREGNSWLDSIFMSTEQNALPVLASEFDGRERTASPRAIEWVDGLAVSWGELKRGM